MLKFDKHKQAGYFSKKNKKSIKRSNADHWFSLFIRIRDVFLVRSPEEAYCYCVTCQKLIHWKKRSTDDKQSAECGHFATRGHPSTRFDEKNCHAQCKKCNRWGKGEQVKHGFAIDEKYGAGTSKKLIEMSEIRGQKRLTKLALDDIAKTYRTKARELAKEKGIKLN